MILIDVEALRRGGSVAEVFFRNLHARGDALVFCDADGTLDGAAEDFALEHGAVVYGHSDDAAKFWAAVFRSYGSASVLVSAGDDYTALALAALDESAPSVKLRFDDESQQFVAVR